jgi:hypothetical protein
MSTLRNLAVMALIGTSLNMNTSPVFAAELVVDVYGGTKECDDSEKVKSGDHLEMHYTGTIDESSETGEKGKKFDSSRDRGKTFGTQIGVGRVIKGWDQGIVGLCKGAQANLIIPPELGYGASGAGGDIPGGATLHFDVEVVGITDGPPPPPNLFEQLDTNKDSKLDKDEVLAYFKEQGQDDLPPGLWEKEDKDADGFIAWDEFGGPKGDAAPSYDGSEL